MINSNSTMIGKICVVTGATSGIGTVTAHALAAQGATVLLVGRNEAKSAAIVERMRRETGNQAIDYLIADLSAQAHIRQLSQALHQRYQHLHVLINNAGALFMTRQLSIDGYEMTFALNHLSYFLLTNLLLDMLKASAPARIINVASDAHTSAQLALDDVQGERHFSGFRAYAQSKLANIMFTYELARRLEGSGVTANTLHPGVVATEFGANNGALSRVLRRIANIVSISPEKGAQTSIFLASSPTVEGVTGAYFVKSKPARSSAVSYDHAAAAHLWRISEDMTGIHTLQSLA